MNADDLQELYNLLRGSRSALMVLDVRTLFLEKRMIEAHALLLESRDLYSESRTRLLRQQPNEDAGKRSKEEERQSRRLKRKQEKTREILKRFDELAAHLQKFATRQKQRLATRKVAAQAASETTAEDPSEAKTDGRRIEPAADSGQHDTEIKIARPSAVTPEFANSFRQASGDVQLGLIGRHFGFQEVTSEKDIHRDAIYFIHNDEQNFLVKTLQSEASGDDVSLADAINARPMKPLTKKAFLKLGKKRKMVLLTIRNGLDEAASDTADHESVDDADSDHGDAGHNEPAVIDMGAFSQLLMSAQRCGLVPAADQIGHVRDREFRTGKYDLAFQTIDGLFAKFSASMNQRNQQLIREDADIASGRVKMSPKDLQAKRARDRIQTQEIDRARRRFQVVLEGLRMLINAG